MKPNQDSRSFIGKQKILRKDNADEPESNEPGKLSSILDPNKLTDNDHMSAAARSS